MLERAKNGFIRKNSTSSQTSMYYYTQHYFENEIPEEFYKCTTLSPSKICEMCDSELFVKISGSILLLAIIIIINESDIFVRTT